MPPPETNKSEIGRQSTMCQILADAYVRLITRAWKNEVVVVVVVVVLVLVLISTRITKSVVTGQAPVTLELRNTPGKKHRQTKGGAAYITTDD